MLSENEIISRYNRPWLFYFLATVGSWGAWFLAAWLSRRPEINTTTLFIITALECAGLFAPFIVAWSLTRHDRVLRCDLHSRLTHFGSREMAYAGVGVIIMFGSILLAQAISLCFGHSIQQFSFAGHASFSAGILSGWWALILAPFIEELSWHTYGTDTLRRRMNLFWTSMLFAFYWVFWHAPLGLIAGYYQANVVESGWLYSANFAVSLFPFVLIMNWLYYRARRSVLVAVIFHISAGFANELFATHPDSKVIQTGLLLLLCVVLIAADPTFFFKKEPD